MIDSRSLQIAILLWGSVLEAAASAHLDLSESVG